VLALVEGLRARGSDASLGVLADASSAAFVARAKAAGVPIAVLPAEGRDYLRDVRGLAAELRGRGATVLHTHGYRADIVGLLAARRAGRAVMATAHGFTHGGLKNRLNQRVQVAALRRHDAVVAVSAPLQAELAKRGVPRPRLVLIRNAWRPPGPMLTRPEARGVLGLPPEGRVVGWVGRLAWVKAADVALAAFAAAATPDATLAIVGDGPDRAALEAAARGLGLAGRVSFHGAVGDAWRLMPAFDALLLSSHSEGTPIVLLEAMHAGVPIVATAVGGVPDLVGEGALLAPAGDPAALGAALARALADPDGCRARVAAARARLDTDFAPDAWIDRHLDLYRRLAARNAP
jgi:glycosyltransferase involved in cell wall biosynthesis